MKDIDGNVEYNKIEIDNVLIKEIQSLKPKKLKKTGARKFDLSKYIGIINSDEEITDSVRDHDLL